MNKTIKIIDLLNKIANGEKVPKKIQYKGKIFEYKEGFYGEGYCKEYARYTEWFKDTISLDERKKLNSTVEILEDNTEEIEELKLKYRDTNYFNMLSEEAKVKWLFKYIQEDEDKINELVRAVNQIRKEKE